LGSFYGQESGRRLGLKELSIDLGVFQDNPQPNIALYARTAEALGKLQDDPSEAFSLLVALTKDAEPGDVRLLEDVADQIGGIFFRTLIGRYLAFHGIVARDVMFPHPALKSYGDLPGILTLGIIRQESSFKADARSSAGALGLMQILPKTARTYGVGRQDLLNPQKNVVLGTKIMRDLLARFDQDLVLSMAGYNAGPNAVESWIRRFKHVEALGPIDWIEMIPYGETRGYVQRIPTGARIYQGYPDAVVPLTPLNDLATLPKSPLWPRRRP